VYQTSRPVRRVSASHLLVILLLGTPLSDSGCTLVMAPTPQPRASGRAPAAPTPIKSARDRSAKLGVQQFSPSARPARDGDSIARIPNPGRQEPPPTGPRVRPPRPPEGAPVKDLAELKSKYGITVRGEYKPRDVERVINVAKLYRPEETRDLTINFVPKSSGSGLMGRWFSRGFLEMFSRGEDTLTHETGHHITLYPKNTRTIALAKRLFSQATGGTNDASRIPAKWTPTAYALKSASEFKAETLMAVAAYQKRIRMEDDRVRSSFKPAELVATVNEILAPTSR
jgi:hypothetical protein